MIFVFSSNCQEVLKFKMITLAESNKNNFINVIFLFLNKISSSPEIINNYEKKIEDGYGWWW
jgi:hypothetical protein